MKNSELPVERTVSSREGFQFSRVKDFIVAVIIFVIFSVLKKTWRIQEQPWPEWVHHRLSLGQPVAFAHFHEDEWALIGAFAHRGMGVLVSHSKDGGRMARFLGFLGFVVLRGSSSRGGAVGLLGLLRFAKKSRYPIVSLAVDGPRGPRRVVKPGVIGLAEALDSDVCCGAAVASSAWVLRKSWNRAFIPKPFSKINIVYLSSSIREPTAIEKTLEDAKKLAGALPSS